MTGCEGEALSAGISGSATSKQVSGGFLCLSCSFQNSHWVSDEEPNTACWLQAWPQAPGALAAAGCRHPGPWPLLAG